jgi:hypothetical protein
MRNKLIAAAALVGAVLAANTASAGGISVYYLYDLGMSQSAFIKTFAHAKSVQAEISGNPALASELRAQGVQIKNVILSKPAFDGSTIYYVK